VRSNYHALQELKRAQARLRKALITSCNKEILNCISECVLNVLNGIIKLSGFNSRKLQKHKGALRMVTDKHVSIAGKKRLIV